MSVARLAAVVVLVASACGVPPVPPRSALALVQGPTFEDGGVVVPKTGLRFGASDEYAVPPGVPVFFGVGPAAESPAVLEDLAVEAPSGVRLLAQGTGTSFTAGSDTFTCFATLGFHCTRPREFKELFAVAVFEAPGTYALRVVDRATGTADTFDVEVSEAVVDWRGFPETEVLEWHGASARVPTVRLRSTDGRRPVFAAVELTLLVNGHDQLRQHCPGVGSCQPSVRSVCAGTFAASLEVRAPGAGLAPQQRRFTVSIDQAFVDRWAAATDCPP